MRKLFAVLGVLLLLVTGLFFYKGGYHALAVLPKLEGLLSQDSGSYLAEVHVNGDEAVFQSPLQWEGSGEKRIWSLPEYGVYVQEEILVLDNGKAYELEMPELPDNLLWGLVLHGRMTRGNDGQYAFNAEADGWSLNVRITCPEKVDNADLQLTYPGGTLGLFLAPEDTPPAPVSQTVRDALVLANMEEPMELSEPLKALTPLMELDSLAADVTLGVECGLLNLTESARLTVENGNCTVTRQGVEFEIALGENGTAFNPLPLGLALLKYGEYTPTESGAIFQIDLPTAETEAICAQLVPQLADLGLTFNTASATLTVGREKLQSLTLTAGGTVPFLFSDIPIGFTADIQVN